MLVVVAHSMLFNTHTPHPPTTLIGTCSSGAKWCSGKTVCITADAVSVTGSNPDRVVFGFHLLLFGACIRPPVLDISHFA